MSTLSPSLIVVTLIFWNVFASQATPVLPNGKTFEAREMDWRNGAIVYQILVDRFVPSDHLEAKNTSIHHPRFSKNGMNILSAAPS